MRTHLRRCCWLETRLARYCRDAGRRVSVRRPTDKASVRARRAPRIPIPLRSEAASRPTSRILPHHSRRHGKQGDSAAQPHLSLVLPGAPNPPPPPCTTTPRHAPYPGAIARTRLEEVAGETRTTSRSAPLPSYTRALARTPRTVRLKPDRCREKRGPDPPRVPVPRHPRENHGQFLYP